MMKKNSILAMLMVLIAALFGSSFVACTNPVSGFDSETPAESYIEAEISGYGIIAKLISVSGCTTVDDVLSIPDYTTVTVTDNPLVIDVFFSDPESVKNRIRESNLYRSNKYVILRYAGNSGELYELEITDTDVLLKATATNTESAAR